MSFTTLIKEKLRRQRKVTRLKKKYKKTDPKMVPQDFSFKGDFETSRTPLVSIIIPFYNEENYTKNCLYYLHENISSNYSYEIILIDDNSSENCDFSEIKGLHIIKNKTNLGFLKNINLGIKQAKGDYVYILNNDTEVQKHFLEELFYVFENHKNVGAVGSLLINSNNTIQEAGAVFLNGLDIHQIFRKKELFYPEVNYVKRVDYCSGCSLLFKRNDDDGALNLFDEQFVPAYFEETDLCFNLKFNQNKNIYYTPFSKVVHFNGVSYNKSDNSNPEKTKQKAFLFETNKEKFKKKWHNELETIKANSIPSRVLELYKNKSITFFTMTIPKHDKDSGSNRLKEIITLFVNKGYHVTLVVKNSYLPNKYIELYQKLGVFVFYEYLINKDYLNFIKLHQSKSNFIWFYGADAFKMYYAPTKQLFESAISIFDMVDVHHLRQERALDIEPKNNALKKSYERYKNIETIESLNVDFVITVSDKEKEYMQAFIPKNKLITISNIHEPKINKEKITSFDNREGIIFIGSIHTPNVDALYFLYRDIMPLVWKEKPDLKVHIIGNISSLINDISDKRFIFHGYVPEISKHFNAAKLMVAPLRYGAGVKGKVGQAFEFYLPVVTTTIGSEGMFLENNINALVANKSDHFANAILKLYNNKTLWNTLSQNSELSLKPFSKVNLENKINEITASESLKTEDNRIKII